MADTVDIVTNIGLEYAVCEISSQGTNDYSDDDAPTTHSAEDLTAGVTHLHLTRLAAPIVVVDIIVYPVGCRAWYAHHVCRSRGVLIPHSSSRLRVLPRRFHCDGVVPVESASDSVLYLHPFVSASTRTCSHLILYRVGIIHKGTSFDRRRLIDYCRHDRLRPPFRGACHAVPTTTIWIEWQARRVICIRIVHLSAVFRDCYEGSEVFQIMLR